MKQSLLVLLTLVALSSTAAGAERLELDNGLTLLVDRRPTAPAVSVVALVRAGRRHEPAGLGGAAHLTEHMLFRATGRRPGGGMEREAWRVGARLSAATHEDFVELGIVVPTERLDLALDLISDMLTSAEIRPGELTEERRVVLDEIAKRNGDAEGWAWEELTGLTFLPHPLGARLAGTARSVASIDRDRLHEFYRRHYRPERTVIVLAGDIEPASALARVRARFGGWRQGPGAPPEPAPAPSELGRYQEMTVTREGAAPLLLASAKLPGYLHPDYLPSRFLKELLGGWLTRRLVTEEQVAVAADVFHSSLVERGLLRFRIHLADPTRAAEARDALLSLLREVRGTRFRFQGVARVAEYLYSREVLVEEDLRGLARLIGRAALAGYYDGEGLPEHLAAPDRYRRVSDAGVRSVAREYLTPANLRVLFLLPAGSKPPDPARLSGESGAGRIVAPGPVARIEAVAPARDRHAGGRPDRDADATRVVLPDGPVLVHLRRPGSRAVACSVVFRAGSRLDPQGREGLAALTWKSLALATEGRPGGEVRWRLFSMGNRWDFAVDRETSRVTFVVPREAAARALEATAEVLTRPAFTEAAVDEARGRLVSEVRRNRDRVASFAGVTFRDAVYERSPYGHEPPGTAESLAGVAEKDLRRFHAVHLRLNSAVVSIVGDLSQAEARALAKRVFCGHPRAPFHLAPPDAGGTRPHREIRVAHPSRRGYAILGGPAPSLIEPGFAKASLLKVALGWLVFDELTNVRSVAYEAGAFHHAYRDRGSFGIHVGAAPERLGEIRKVLMDRLRVVAERGFDPSLVADARSAWLGGVALTSARSDLVATRLAYREALGLGHASFDAVREQVEKLGPADLRDLCRSIFAPHRMTTVLVNPR